MDLRPLCDRKLHDLSATVENTLIASGRDEPTGGDRKQVAAADSLEEAMGALLGAGERLMDVLDSDYASLQLPPLPKAGIGVGELASALAGVKAELEALKAEAITELTDVLDGAKDALSEALGDIDDEALSVNAMHHPCHSTHATAPR